MTGFNSLRAGGTAQLKFEVFAGSIQLTSADIVASVDEEQLTCAAETKKGKAGGSGRRRTGGGRELDGRVWRQWPASPSGGHSPDLPGTCWRVTVRHDRRLVPLRELQAPLTSGVGRPSPPASVDVARPLRACGSSRYAADPLRRSGDAVRCTSEQFGGERCGNDGAAMHRKVRICTYRSVGRQYYPRPIQYC